MGAGNGGFLKIIKEHQPDIKLAAYDKDQSSNEAIAKYCDIDMNDLNDAIIKGYKFDIVCLFHVFEQV